MPERNPPGPINFNITDDENATTNPISNPTPTPIATNLPKENCLGVGFD
jgi:hypothetical protein